MVDVCDYSKDAIGVCGPRDYALAPVSNHGARDIVGFMPSIWGNCAMEMVMLELVACYYLCLL